MSPTHTRTFSIQMTWKPLLYSYMQYHNDTIIKTQEDFFIKIYTSHFICKGSKRLFQVLWWEGAGDRAELQYFHPHSYGRQRCVCWLSLPHLISNLSSTVPNCLTSVLTELYNSSTRLHFYHSSPWNVWISILSWLHLRFLLLKQRT